MMELENNLTKDQLLDEEAERVRGELNKMLSDFPASFLSNYISSIKFLLFWIALTIIMIALYIWHPW
jgi:hypothetical protein